MRKITLEEAQINYKKCYEEAKHYTSYKKEDNANEYDIICELEGKAYGYKTITVPFFISSIFILIICLGEIEGSVTVKACVGLITFATIVFITIWFNYRVNKYLDLKDNLMRAKRSLNYLKYGSFRKETFIEGE